jgi:hypothetical protein
LPVEATHLDFGPGAEQAVVLEAGALLAERREEQGILVPVGDGGMEAGRDDDFAVESSLQRGIAANVVGMGMGVDQAAEGTAGERVANEVDRLPGMADIAAVDQRRPVATRSPAVPSAA